MEYITDRAERQVNRLTAHVRENKDFANIVRALGGAKWQALEDVYNDLLTKRHLGDAAGVHLNVIGRHLVTPRYGLEDAPYTVLLDSRFIFFQRSGEPERLIQLFQTLTGAETVKYDDTYKLQCNNLIGYFPTGSEAVIEALNVETIVADMRKAKQAGQGLRLVLVIEPAFRFSDDPDIPTLSSPYGFDAGKLGGVLIEV